MGWVVKSWRPEALMAARRELADTDAWLAELERFATETRAHVREQRRRPAAEPAPSPRRAALHDSPLVELFRATAPR
jgi:hypothetical protein